MNTEANLMFYFLFLLFEKIEIRSVAEKYFE